MARPDKAAAVAELAEKFRVSNAAVLTEYRGLTVAQLKQLRRLLAAHASYAVVKNTLTAIAAKQAGVEGLDAQLAGPKNTLTAIAAKQAGVEGLDAQLAGPSAIAFVTGDPVAVAKGLRDFAKANPHLVIKGGVFEGHPMTAADIVKLADIEPRDVLLAKLAGALKASLFQAAYVFQAPTVKAVRTIDALREKQANAA